MLQVRTARLWIPIALLTLGPAHALADDFEDCLSFVQEGDIRGAEQSCGKLDQADPFHATALGFFEFYGRIGSDRLRIISVQGIKKATSVEKAALDRAIGYFRRGAEAGLADAQFQYAFATSIKKPKPENILEFRLDEEHLDWLRKAADQDHRGALSMLASYSAMPDIDDTAEILRPDLLPYLERAAELGDEDAIRLLGRVEKARQLPAEAEAGDPAAQRIYARKLYSQRPRDTEQALELMRSSADAGDLEAMKYAGLWSWPGNKDDTVKYLKMAAEFSDSKAMMALGNTYACLGDAPESRRWFEKARAMEHPEARYAIAELDEWGIEEWECRYVQ